MDIHTVKPVIPKKYERADKDEDTLREHTKVLREFGAQSQVKYDLLNLAGSLRGARRQTTRRRLLHGAKDDGVGG